MLALLFLFLWVFHDGVKRKIVIIHVYLCFLFASLHVFSALSHALKKWPFYGPFHLGSLIWRHFIGFSYWGCSGCRGKYNHFFLILSLLWHLSLWQGVHPSLSAAHPGSPSSMVLGLTGLWDTPPFAFSSQGGKGFLLLLSSGYLNIPLSVPLTLPMLL